jgi:hypothetical protein
MNGLGVGGVNWVFPWASITREIAGSRLHIACLSSSWLACSEDDRGKLALGLAQVNPVLDGADQADIVIAAMHHPWDWMAEWDRASKTELQRTADLVLRGHLHDASLLDVRAFGRAQSVEIAAGASYETSEVALGYQWIELRPLDRSVRVVPRAWSLQRRDWSADLNRYQARHVDIALPVR